MSNRSLLCLFFSSIFFCSCQKEPKKITLIPLSDIQKLPSEPQVSPKHQELEPYPWQERCEQGKHSSHLRPLTKEYFRCKGSSLHLPRIVSDKSVEHKRFYDCSGGHKHSLPLQDGKEYVYPILIELLNEVQRKTNLPVIVTSGHRCPTHQAYIDSSAKGFSSKHLIAAEVRFYVQGLQEHPEEVIKHLIRHYEGQEKVYAAFQRFEKETDVSTPPWHNKEIFIKLYKSHEGRDFDNRHPYPYISIQVRFDREKNEPVRITHETSNRLLCK